MRFSRFPTYMLLIIMSFTWLPSAPIAASTAPSSTPTPTPSITSLSSAPTPTPSVASSPSDGTFSPPEAIQHTVAPLQMPPEPALPTLAIELHGPLEPIAVGATTSITVVVTNVAPHPADDLLVSLPFPADVQALPDSSTQDAASAWQWKVGHLEGRASVELTATFRLEHLPPTLAILFVPQAIARGLDQPVHAQHGLLVRLPDQEQILIPMSDTQTALANGDQWVVLEGQSAAGDGWTFQLQPDAPQRSLSPSVPALPQGVRGFGAFALSAIDAAGMLVPRLTSPLTLTVRYTLEQLEALQRSPGALTLFQLDAQHQRWNPLTTTIDPLRQTARAALEQPGTFQLAAMTPPTLGDGSSPSATFIPSLQGWQVSLFTGAAQFSSPIEVPIGPGGMKPNLHLSYSSATLDGEYLRTHKQGSWVGLGWDLSTGYVALNKRSGPTTDYYSLVLNGQSTDLVRGEKLPGSPFSGNHIQGWYWHPTNESFLKVRYQQTAHNVGTWLVWTPDGMKYEFGAVALWGWQECQAVEPYKWMLTRVTDAHLNTMTYTYDRLTYQHSCGTVLTPTIWPTSITWGGNLGTGAPDRYKVEFLSVPRRSDGSNNVAPGEDMAWDFAKTQYGGMYGAPHETRKLVAVRVLSKPGSDWQLVRQYNFEYAAWNESLYSEGIVCAATCGPNPGYRKLTLTRVTRVAADGVTVLPSLSFGYGTDRGTAKFSKGGWNRLTRVDNGQGGVLTFAYDHIALVYSTVAHLFDNHHRVIAKTIEDGQGNRALTTYLYGLPATNWLGSVLGADELLRPAPNAAPVYFAHAEDQLAALAVGMHREFRGHEWVEERTYDGPESSRPLLQIVKHYFDQGEGDPDNNPENGTGCIPTDNVETDACFVSLRAHEFTKGREWKTVWMAANGAKLKEIVRHYGVGAPLYASGIDYTAKHTRGLWRAFSYEQQVEERTYEGQATPKILRTTYAYDPTNQTNGGGTHFGNLGQIDVYDATGVLYRRTKRLYTTRNEESWNWTDTPPTYRVRYLADRMWANITYDGMGRLLALTQHFYDDPGHTQRNNPMYVGEQGDLTRVARYYDVPLQPNALGMTLHGQDTTYTYDAYGNHLTETTYAEAGTRLWNGSTWTISMPGNGSAARTTRTIYDDIFHVYPTMVTNAVGHVNRAGYNDRMGTLTSVTDPNGNTTSAEYDNFGRMVKLIKPGDSSAIPGVMLHYMDWERPVRYQQNLREVSGDGGAYRPIQRFYDGLGRLIQTKSESQNGSQNIVVDTRYDGLGRATQQSQPRYVDETVATTFWSYVPPGATLHNATTTTYDALSRVLTITTPDGSLARHVYGVTTSSGIPVTYDDTIDANRHRTQHRYDAFGRLIEVYEISGDCGNYWAQYGYGCQTPFTSLWTIDAKTTYTYTPRDELSSVTDTNGNVTSMTYDSLGRKTRMADPDMGSWTYGYDANGNLIQQTDAKNQTIRFAYDALDRLTTKTYPDTTTAIYRYDEPRSRHGIGHRTSIERTTTSSSVTTIWHYDERGRTTQSAQYSSWGSGPRTFDWTYDSADRIQTITYPTTGANPREVVTYTYDAAWRQTSVCSSLANTPCYVQHAQYTALDQPSQQTFGNNTTQTWTYASPLQRLHQLQVGRANNLGLHFNRSYRYDNAGNVTAITDNNTSSNSQTFGYDHRDRLTNWTLGNITQQYSYDAIGNLTNKAGVGYSYGTNGNGTGPGPHQARSVGGQSYRYDANGNLVSGGGRSYTWNADNLPESVTDDGVTERYSYDADGERVARTRNGSTTLYVNGLWEEGPDTTNVAPNASFESSGSWTPNTPAEFPGSSYARWDWGAATPRDGRYAQTLSNHAYGYLQSDPIPVSANTEYDLYVWLRGNMLDPTSGTWLVRAVYYDSMGNYLSQVNAAGDGPGSLNTNWQQKGGRIRTPAHTAKLSVELYHYMSSGWVAFDDVSLIQIGTTTNLITNPSFEGATNWREIRSPQHPGTAFYRWNWATATPRSGNYAYVISNQVYAYLQSDPVHVKANTEYDLTAWVTGNLLNSTSASWVIRAVYYDSMGNVVGQSDPAGGLAGSISNRWQQKGGRIRTPANTATLMVELYHYLSNGWVSYDDIALIEVGTSTNLVLNPSFESHANWTILKPREFGGSSVARWNWGITAPHSGNYSYTLSNQTYNTLRSDRIPVNAHTDYDLYAWLRGNIVDPTSGWWIIRAVYYDSAGNYVGQTNAVSGGPGSLNTTWQQKGGRIRTPATTATLAIELYHYMSNGWVTFDDVTLTPVRSIAKATYTFNGTPIAVRNLDTQTVTYLHGDHLGSMSLATDQNGAAGSKQEFDPWGKVRSGGISDTTLNYTGQRLDSTGLLYYHARMYDPAIGRFISADSIVPGSASGSGGSAATLGIDASSQLSPLTVDFHETAFVSVLNGENAFKQSNGFWFQLDGDGKQKAKSPFGPSNPQALNRYAYVLNNPLRYTDPTGHNCMIIKTIGEAQRALTAIADFIGEYALAFTITEATISGGFKEAVLAELKLKYNDMVAKFGADFASFIEQLTLALADIADSNTAKHPHGIYISFDDLSTWSNQYTKMRWGDCLDTTCEKKYILGISEAETEWFGDVWLWKMWSNEHVNQQRNLWSKLWDSQVPQN